MLAFLRSRLARSAPPGDRDACMGSPGIDEGAFEHLQTAPISGLGAELREWLPVAWADGEAGMASSRCRA